MGTVDTKNKHICRRCGEWVPDAPGHHCTGRLQEDWYPEKYTTTIETIESPIFERIALTLELISVQLGQLVDILSESK